MSASELKLHIINKVSSINDASILKEIYKLVNMESEIDTEYRLSAEEKKAIELGLKDIEEGRVYTSEQADNMLKEWLRK
jgi:predicted transcriptional regulator